MGGVQRHKGPKKKKGKIPVKKPVQSDGAEEYLKQLDLQEKAAAITKKPLNRDVSEALLERLDLQEKTVTMLQKQFTDPENQSAEKKLENLAALNGKRGISQEDIAECADQKRLEEECDRELHQALEKQFNYPESMAEPEYGDGDQTMMYGNAAKKLQIQWGGGYLGYNPNASYPPRSDWCKALFFGKIEQVKQLMSKANEGSGVELAQLLDKRESMLRMGGILHIIAGCKQETSKHHVTLLKMLLEAGANPNIKDAAGYSALHHCCTIYGNSKTFEIAQILVEYGADVNATNRLGCTPLTEPCLSANFDIIEFLISNGANPCIKDNNGTSCQCLAAANPKILRILSRSMRTLAKKDKKEQKSNSTSATVACVLCGDLENLKKCTSCLAVSYCSRECQKAHWSTHKPECKKQAIESKLVIVKPMKDNLNPQSPDGRLFSIKHKKILDDVGGFSTLKKPFKIKIQLGLNPATNGPDPDTPMMVYNKDRSYQVFILPTDPGFKEVLDAIADRGYCGLKAYFLATLEKPGELSINVMKVFPETF